MTGPYSASTILKGVFEFDLHSQTGLSQRGLRVTSPMMQSPCVELDGPCRRQLEIIIYYLDNAYVMSSDFPFMVAARNMRGNSEIFVTYGCTEFEVYVPAQTSMLNYCGLDG